jgi:hypothetical protein
MEDVQTHGCILTKHAGVQGEEGDDRYSGSRKQAGNAAGFHVQGAAGFAVWMVESARRQA